MYYKYNNIIIDIIIVMPAAHVSQLTNAWFVDESWTAFIDTLDTCIIDTFYHTCKRMDIPILRSWYRFSL